MCVSMVGEEDGESSRRGYQDVLVGECGLVKKKKKKVWSSTYFHTYSPGCK